MSRDSVLTSYLVSCWYLISNAKNGSFTLVKYYSSEKLNSLPKVLLSVGARIWTQCCQAHCTIHPPACTMQHAALFHAKLYAYFLLSWYISSYDNPSHYLYLLAALEHFRWACACMHTHTHKHPHTCIRICVHKDTCAHTHPEQNMLNFRILAKM